MKVVAKPIDMVSWTDKEGNVHPVRFRLQQPDESYVTIKVDRVVCRELEKLAGNKMLVYKCQSIVGGVQKIFELKYELGTCKWILFKI